MLGALRVTPAVGQEVSPVLAFLDALTEVCLKSLTAFFLGSRCST